jgi:molybdate transport system substrate-binding protein
VVAAVSLEEVLGQLLADYSRREPSVSVRTILGASDALADQVLAGSPAHLFLTADARQLDRLEKAGLVQPGPRTLLAGNALAAIGPARMAKPVRRVGDLVEPAVARVALAEPAAPLGSYTRAYLESQGLYDAVRARAVQLENSRAVVTAVQAGLADVGLVYHSDAVRAAGCRVLFRVRRSPSPIRYAAAVIGRGAMADKARSLLHFLTEPPALSRFRRCGFTLVRHPAAST